MNVVWSRFYFIISFINYILWMLVQHGVNLKLILKLFLWKTNISGCAMFKQEQHIPVSSLKPLEEYF